MQQLYILNYSIYGSNRYSHSVTMNNFSSNFSDSPKSFFKNVRTFVLDNAEDFLRDSSITTSDIYFMLHVHNVDSPDNYSAFFIKRKINILDFIKISSCEKTFLKSDFLLSIEKEIEDKKDL